MQNPNAILAIVGILGGLVCAAADYLLGTYKVDHDRKKCIASAVIGTFSVPAALCGYVSLTNQLSLTSPALALTFRITTYVALAAALVIHIGTCQKLLLTYEVPEAKAVMQDLNEMDMAANGIGLLCLTLVPLSLLIAAVAKGYLAVPPALLLLNPLPFVICFGITKKAFGKPFPPGPMSLGQAGFAVIALVAAL